MVYFNMFASFVFLFIGIVGISGYKVKVQSVPIQEIPHLRFKVLIKMPSVKGTLYSQRKITQYINYLPLEFGVLSISDVESAGGIDEASVDEVLESPLVVNVPLENDNVSIEETMELSTLETLPSEEDELPTLGDAPIVKLIDGVFCLVVAIVSHIFRISKLIRSLTKFEVKFTLKRFAFSQ